MKSRRRALCKLKMAGSWRDSHRHRREPTPTTTRTTTLFNHRVADAFDVTSHCFLLLRAHIFPNCVCPVAKRARTKSPRTITIELNGHDCSPASDCLRPHVLSLHLKAVYFAFGVQSTLNSSYSSLNSSSSSSLYSSLISSSCTGLIRTTRVVACVSLEAATSPLIPRGVMASA